MARKGLDQIARRPYQECMFPGLPWRVGRAWEHACWTEPQGALVQQVSYQCPMRATDLVP